MSTAVAEPEYYRAKPHHDASLTNGGPENYKLWYKDYENYHLDCLGWQGPDSAVGSWMKACDFECRRKGDMVPSNHKEACDYLFPDGIKVYDAGCGTGLVAERLISLSGIPRKNIEIFGGDYSSDMIGLAEKKQVYDHLRVDNLKEPLVYDDNQFDVVLSSGVFLQGHCGPECIPNIIRVLKPGCFFVTTVRALFYDQTKEEWARQINLCGADLLSDSRVPYMTKVEAVAVVIRKKDCARAKPHHDASLSNGGPENYKLWYKDYEAYHLDCLGWQGPDSAVGTWMKACEEECKKKGLTPKDKTDACKLLYQPGDRKLQVYDAGCGTGLVAERLISQSGLAREEIEIFGGDYSSDMIGLAEKKKVYDHLRVDNLKEPLTYSDNQFDVILSSGVFLQGHCGPECIPNIIRVLKPGCFFVTTVRALFYDQTKEEWARQTDLCGGILLSDSRVPYMTKVEAVAVVIQKK